MSLTPSMIDQALIDVLLKHDIKPSEPLPIDAMQSMWAQTGLRSYDLTAALERAVAAGLLEVEPTAGHPTIRLSHYGRQRVLGFGGGPGVFQELLLRWRRERFIGQRRRRGSAAAKRQRTTDRTMTARQPGSHD